MDKVSKRDNPLAAMRVPLCNMPPTCSHVSPLEVSALINYLLRSIRLRDTGCKGVEDPGQLEVEAVRSL